MVITAIFRKASCKDKRGMRYEAEFLMECLLLRIRSKAAYQKILERKLLPLPSPSTLRRLLSSLPCNFGMNDFALSAIKKHLQGLPRSERYGSLVWDEMSIAEDVTFNSQKMQFDGYVDYGEGVHIKNHECQLADKGLIFVFRPYRASWIQPFAVFSAKGAAPGVILHELLSKAIVALHSQGAIVKNLVCDGAQSNKTVMSLFGVSGGLTADSQSCFNIQQTLYDQTETLINQEPCKIPKLLFDQTDFNENRIAFQSPVFDLRKPADDTFIEMIKNPSIGHTLRDPKCDYHSASRDDDKILSFEKVYDLMEYAVWDCSYLDATYAINKLKLDDNFESIPQHQSFDLEFLMDNDPLLDQNAYSDDEECDWEFGPSQRDPNCLPKVLETTTKASDLVADSNEITNEFLDFKKVILNAKPVFNHLIDESEKIYFFVDVPHLFKCVRNYIFNRKNVQVSEILK